MFSLRPLLLTCICALGAASPAYAQAEGEETKGKSLINRVIDYFDQSNKREITSRPNFTLLGGPHFSSDKGVGLGLVLAGDYTTAPGDTLTPVSNVALVGDVASKDFYVVGVEGTHVFAGNNRRIIYDMAFQWFETYFWGVGYSMGVHDANKTRYQSLKASLTVDYEWRIAPGLFVGPALDANWYKASSLRDPMMWAGLPTGFTTVGLGGRLQYDTRDNLTGPHHGSLLELKPLFFPSFFGNRHRAFMSFDLAYNLYTPVWKGGLVATRFHTQATVGRTPWAALPHVGGRNMRAYYPGRYRDKCFSDATVELRQHLYRRFGMVAWGGVAAIYHKPSDLRLRWLLPEVGAGVRWELKKNVNLRVDVGFGRHCTGVLFGLNESF